MSSSSSSSGPKYNDGDGGQRQRVQWLGGETCGMRCLLYDHWVAAVVMVVMLKLATWTTTYTHSHTSLARLQEYWRSWGPRRYINGGEQGHERAHISGDFDFTFFSLSNGIDWPTYLYRWCQTLAESLIFSFRQLNGMTQHIVSGIQHSLSWQASSRELFALSLSLWERSLFIQHLSWILIYLFASKQANI